MKTSASQFDLMVTFMEQHGDLSKPSSNARGRISTLKRWEELCALLNSDGSGDTKGTEKWKKVWSDYKNNTKKKAARLHRAASGTGLITKLTDVEQRVLNIIGTKVATGLPVEEVGLSQGIQLGPNESVDVVLISPSPPHLNPSQTVECSQAYNISGPPTQPETAVPATEAGPVSSPPHVFVDVEIENVTPTRPVSRSPAYASRPLPAFSGQTTPRNERIRRTRRSPRRRLRPTHTEHAAQHFLHSDEEWRNEKKNEKKKENLKSNSTKTKLG